VGYWQEAVSIEAGRLIFRTSQLVKAVAQDWIMLRIFSEQFKQEFGMS